MLDSSRQALFRLRTTAVPPSASLKSGWVGSTPESMTATETPVPSSLVPLAPVRVSRASAPRVAVLEVSSKNRIGLVALEVGDAGLLSGGGDLARVPLATATPILSNVVTSRRPLARHRGLAVVTLPAWTITVRT